MNESLSKKIKLSYGILSLMIVLLHSTYSYIPEYTDGKWVQFQFEIMRFITIITPVTVSTFFVISSYLFFYTNQGIKDYFIKLKKRMFSVAIPYFIWAIVTYAYYFMIVNYTNVFDSKVVPSTGIEIIKYILLCEGNPPLWYLRTLLYFFIVSPIIHFIMVKLKRKSAFIIVVVYICNLFFKPEYTTLLYWLPLILIGTWLALYGQNFLTSKETFSIKSRFIALCFGIGYIIILFLLNDEHHILFYTWRIISVGIFWILICGFKNLRLDFISSISFFMYCTHFIVIEAVRGVLIKVLGVQTWSVLLIFLLTFCITVMIVCLTANILKRHFGFLWKKISGGR